MHAGTRSSPAVDAHRWDTHPEDTERRPAWTMRAMRQGGYTLTELLVIMIILGVLAAIAIATFLLQRDKAERSSAISTLRNVRTFAEAIRAEQGTYATDPATYTAQARPYRFVGASVPSASERTVSVSGLPAGRDGAVFAVRGGASCYYLRVEAPNTEVRHREAATDVDCRADEFLVGAGSGW